MVGSEATGKKEKGEGNGDGEGEDKGSEEGGSRGEGVAGGGMQHDEMWSHSEVQMIQGSVVLREARARRLDKRFEMEIEFEARMLAGDD